MRKAATVPIELDLERYGIAFALDVSNPASNITFDFDTVASILQEHRVIEDEQPGYEFVSVRLPLVLEMRPGYFSLSDYSSLMPARPEWLGALENLLEYIGTQEYPVVGYGWYAAGIVNGIDLPFAVDRIVRRHFVEQMLDLKDAQGLEVPQLNFVGSSSFADDFSLNLRLVKPDQLGFVLHEQFKKTPPSVRLLFDQGEQFGRLVSKTLENLTRSPQAEGTL